MESKSRSKSRREIPGRNGGTLIAGQGRGPKPGEGGRPPSWIREQLRGTFAERIAFLTSVVDGTPLVKMRVLMMDVAPHCVCPNCGEAGLQPKGIKDAVREITVTGSAPVKERLHAMDIQAKYGMGTTQELTGKDGERLFTASEREQGVVDMLAELRKRKAAAG